MLDNNIDDNDDGNCPYCNQSLMPYRYDCVRWNGVVCHVSCALIVADRLLESAKPSPL